jgi:hypothetical protein
VGLTLGAWIAPTLVNSWTDASGTGFGCSPGYRKLADGQHVELAGLFSGGASNTVAFTLPVGFRPKTFKFHPIANGGSGTVVYCTIQTTGDVSLLGTTAISLDGVIFPLDR